MKITAEYIEKMRRENEAERIRLMQEDVKLMRKLHELKETQSTSKEDLTARTAKIDEFRKDYLGGKSAEWVRAKIFDRYPEVVYDPAKETGWVLNPHGQGKSTIIYLKPATKWLEEHMYEINLNEKL